MTHIISAHTEVAELTSQLNNEADIRISSNINASAMKNQDTGFSEDNDEVFTEDATTLHSDVFPG